MIAIVKEPETGNSNKTLLMAELRHLEWYKMANASALKAALKQARSLKNVDGKSTALQVQTKNTLISTSQMEKVK